MKNTMEYRGYVGSVEFSEADQLLFGKVQGIRSLISSRIFTVLLTITSHFVTLKGQLLKRPLKVVLTFALKTLIFTNVPQYMPIITT